MKRTEVVSGPVNPEELGAGENVVLRTLVGYEIDLILRINASEDAGQSTSAMHRALCGDLSQVNEALVETQRASGSDEWNIKLSMRRAIESAALSGNYERANELLLRYGSCHPYTDI